MGGVGSKTLANQDLALDISAIWRAPRQLELLVPLKYLEAFEVGQLVSCNHAPSIKPRHVVFRLKPPSCLNFFNDISRHVAVI